MRFLVARRDILIALDTISPVIGGKDDYCLIRPVAGKHELLEVMTYKGRLRAAAPFTAPPVVDDSAAGGRTSFTIIGRRLLTWVKCLPPDSMLIIEHDASANRTAVAVRGSEKRMFFASDAKEGLEFPNWDENLAAAKPTGRLHADRLGTALECSKRFTGERLPKAKVAPEGLCVTEFRGGMLTSTDKDSVCLITMQGAASVTLRIHKKDARAVVAFLVRAKGESVALVESEKMSFLRRGDSSYLGLIRFSQTFPKLDSPTMPDDVVWELSATEMRQALTGLLSGADMFDDRVWISRPESDGPLVLTAVAATADESSSSVEVLSTTKRPDAPRLPKQIGMHAAHLTKLLSVIDGDRFSLGALRYKASGFFRVRGTKFVDERHGDAGDEYAIFLSWLTPKTKGAAVSTDPLPQLSEKETDPTASSPVSTPNTVQAAGGDAPMVAESAIKPSTHSTDHDRRGHRNRLVVLPSLDEPIRLSPGFDKKGLSIWKLDLMALCGFGCTYCSSNNGNYLRINRKRFADLAEEQLGERLYPSTSPELAMVWPDVLEKLKAQIERQGSELGAGETLVFSMLTDAYSGPPLREGTTEAAFRLVMDKTSFRVRVLTKNSAVGTPKWRELFKQYPGRVVVGLSTGTLDEDWARRVEIGTPPPNARIAATRALQAAGVPTFGMLCPIFPDVLEGSQLEQLVDAINPAACEHVWAEPYNDRQNWEAVRAGYEEGSPGWKAMTEMFSGTGHEAWSRYATDLFLRIRAKAQSEGWLNKMRYLLYENDITDEDASRFGSLEGVLLQTKPDKDGISRHSVFAGMQREAALLVGSTPDEGTR